MKTENIMFLSKRIQVATEGKDTQVAVSAENLISAYNSKESHFQGKNHKKVDVETKIVAEAFEADGLKIGLTIEEGKLVLGDTSMSKTLFDAIKATDGADKDKPYYITVTDGSKENPKTKIARIAFTLDGKEVKAELVDLK